MILISHRGNLFGKNKDFENNPKYILEALKAMVKEDIHCFWHQNDDYTLTSEGYIWTYPNKQVTDMSIQMCFNGNFEDIHDIAAGVCSDWIGNYK
jgi:hypothetical protein